LPSSGHLGTFGDRSKFCSDRLLHWSTFGFPKNAKRDVRLRWGVNTALWLWIWVAPLTAAAHAAEGEGARWAQGALEHAITASADIDDPFHRAQSLAEIADAQAGLGHGPEALTLLQRAAELAGKIDNDALGSWARHDIGLAYVKADDLALAQSTAEGIQDLRLRDNVLSAVIDARRAEHDYLGAIEAARRIQDVARQGHALRTVVIAQAGKGDLESALTTARSIVHPALSAVALGDVAAAFAKEGNFTEARTLAARIRDVRARSEALVEVAAGQADAGDVTGALTLAEGIEDKLSRAHALARVAAVRMRFGNTAPGRELFTQSVALAKGARGGAERKAFVLIEIARAQLGSQEKAAARETLQLAVAQAKNIKNNSDRLSLLAQIVPMQARLGDHADAMVTAGRADDSSLRPLLIRDVAASQAETGDVAGAVRAARALQDRPAGAAAFFGIMRVQAQARDDSGMRETIDTALQTVRFIPNDELKAGALGSLAAAFLVLEDKDEALALFDEAMELAARVQPAPARVSAYARIADALGEHGP
jgi:tetratricopeptide (TPR) repeat protein